MNDKLLPLYRNANTVGIAVVSAGWKVFCPIKLGSINETSGIDTQINWATGMWSGNLAIDVIWTHTLDNSFQGTSFGTLFDPERPVRSTDRGARLPAGAEQDGAEQVELVEIAEVVGVEVCLPGFDAQRQGHRPRDFVGQHELDARRFRSRRSDERKRLSLRDLSAHPDCDPKRIH